MYQYPRSAALLPVGDKVNPRNPDRDYWLFEPGMVAYVVQKSPGPGLRVYTSHGDLGDRWAIGTSHEVHHDQTMRRQGTFQVIGIARVIDGELEVDDAIIAVVRVDGDTVRIFHLLTCRDCCAQRVVTDHEWDPESGVQD